MSSQRKGTKTGQSALRYGLKFRDPALRAFSRGFGKLPVITTDLTLSTFFILFLHLARCPTAFKTP